MCFHNALSRVFGRAKTGYYVVCLRCGREFKYDWSEMRITGHFEVTVTPRSILLDETATE